MSYIDFKKAIELIDKNKAKLAYPPHAQNTEKIKLAEKKLNVKFPKSYREFLKKYGSIGIGGIEIYGLWNDVIIKDTLYERESNEENTFPLHYIPIHALGNGELSCLDTSQINKEEECPIMAWYFGSTEKLSEDFGEFLLDKIVSQLKYMSC